MKFHFTIRDVLWLTAMVALGVGWWIDHQVQTKAARYYREANEYWRESAQSTDEMLTKGFGFKIDKAGNRKSYIPPQGLPLSPNWPTP